MTGNVHCLHFLYRSVIWSQTGGSWEKPMPSESEAWLINATTDVSTPQLTYQRHNWRINATIDETMVTRRRRRRRWGRKPRAKTVPIPKRFLATNSVHKTNIPAVFLAFVLPLDQPRNFDIDVVHLFSLRFSSSPLICPSSARISPYVFRRRHRRPFWLHLCRRHCFLSFLSVRWECYHGL